VIVNLIVDVIELRTIDYVNDSDHFGRIAEGDPLASQGEGLRIYVRATGARTPFFIVLESTEGTRATATKNKKQLCLDRRRDLPRANVD